MESDGYKSLGSEQETPILFFKKNIDFGCGKCTKPLIEDVYLSNCTDDTKTVHLKLKVFCHSACRIFGF